VPLAATHAFLKVVVPFLEGVSTMVIIVLLSFDTRLSPVVRKTFL
jgi:hypothetical protein